MSSSVSKLDIGARLRRHWPWLLGLVTIAAAVLHVVYFFPRTVDDCFIYLRYAENLANGNGLVYNIGERVEGFSSPLWVLLLAIGEVLGMGGVSWMKFLGVASLAGLMAGLYRYGRLQLELSPAAAWVAPLSVACNCYVITWTIHGLETPLFLALLVWSAVTLGPYLEAPTRRRLLVFGLVGGAFSLSRPEAPLMLAAVAVGMGLRPLRLAQLRARTVRVIKASLPVFTIFGAYLIFRLAYYGLWLPHTYYAKRSDKWNEHGLDQFLGDGAAFSEAVLLGGGVVLAACMLWRRRDGMLLLVALANAVYVAVVEVDWMPNVRFWLPVWVILPLAWGWAIDRLRPGRVDASVAAEAPSELADEAEERPVTESRQPSFAYRQWLRWMAAGLAATVVLTTAYEQAKTDMRYSIFSYRGRGSKHWKRYKTEQRWQNAVLALQRIPPPHVAEMKKFEMGMITFVYRLIESDARPLDETWFVGRDIGRVGYLTPVNVWETAGLFTPAVIGSEWDRRQVVTRDFLEDAMDRPVVMTQAPGQSFARALARHPELAKRYQPQAGWWHVRARGMKRPSREQILTRYEAALAKLPSAYYIMNLRGGTTGAALERRYHIVKNQAPKKRPAKR